LRPAPLRGGAQIVQTGNLSVAGKMEAMGSDGAKIRAAEPPSDRLATLLRPIGRELKPRHVRLVGPLEPLAR
jgi:hypothetical protein